MQNKLGSYLGGILTGICFVIAALANSGAIADIAIVVINYQREYGALCLTLWVLPAFAIWLYTGASSRDEDSVTDVNAVIDCVNRDGRYEVRRIGGFRDDFDSEAARNRNLLDDVDKVRRTS